MRARKIIILLATSALVACGGGSDSDSGIFSTGGPASGVTATTTDTDPSAGPGGTADGSATSSAESVDGTDSNADSADTGLKLDVAVDTEGVGPCEGPDCMGCTYVDLLFVIDNSASMGGYQTSLGLAFPQFADTLVAALPPGTNVHVGVTSTEMGYSGMGSTSIMNGACTFTGDGGQPNSAFYITPDVTDSGRDGAQGRLYRGTNAEAYFAFDTDDAAAVADLKTWFSAAAALGTGGSNIEMSTAPVGWFADPAVDDPNAGFLRDAGSVLVVFFMQDEPDQTPTMIEGTPAGQWVLDRVAGWKQQCGGLACVIAGGFLNAQACSADGNLPLDDFLAGMLKAPAVQALPDENLAENDPQAAADEMNQHLSTTLAEVIAQTCDEIRPEG